MTRLLHDLILILVTLTQLHLCNFSSFVVTFTVIYDVTLQFFSIESYHDIGGACKLLMVAITEKPGFYAQLLHYIPNVI